MGEEGKPKTADPEADGQGQDVAGEGQDVVEPSQEEKALIEINYRGRAVKLPEDKVKALAQKGYDYETKMASLKEERKQVAADAENFSEFKEFQEYLRQNPAVGSTIQQVLEAAEEKKIVPKLVFEDGEPLESVSSPVAQHISQLEQKIDGFVQSQQVNQLAQKLNSVIDERPVLALASHRSVQKTGNDVVLGRLVQAMQTDPDASVEALADALATELSVVMGETSEGAKEGADLDQKKEEERRFVSESPSGAPGAPAGEAKQTFTLADLKAGRVRQAAMQRLSGHDQ